MTPIIKELKNLEIGVDLKVDGEVKKIQGVLLSVVFSISLRGLLF